MEGQEQGRAGQGRAGQDKITGSGQYQLTGKDNLFDRQVAFRCLASSEKRNCYVRSAGKRKNNNRSRQVRAISSSEWLEEREDHIGNGCLTSPLTPAILKDCNLSIILRNLFIVSRCRAAPISLPLLFLSLLVSSLFLLALLPPPGSSTSQISLIPSWGSRTTAVLSHTLQEVKRKHRGLAHRGHQVATLQPASLSQSLRHPVRFSAPEKLPTLPKAKL
eukprot:767911-Hanusia_phi.AAC.7